MAAPRLPNLRLAALSPFGPIFGKELRATARRRRNYLLRVLYLAALLLSLLVAWAATSNRVYSTSVSAQAQAQAELGAMFFAFFCMFSAVAMAVIGPVLTSTAISAERLGHHLTSNPGADDEVRVISGTVQVNHFNIDDVGFVKAQIEDQIALRVMG